jgi:DNA-binding transcriptional LysR family regulator
LNTDITAVAFAQTPLYAALPENHPAAENESLELQHLAEDDWILFPKRLHPIIHETVMEAARRDRITPKCVHAAVTAEQAVQLVSEQVGVDIMRSVTAPIRTDRKREQHFSEVPRVRGHSTVCRLKKPGCLSPMSGS